MLWGMACPNIFLVKPLTIETFLYPIIDDNEIKNKYFIDHHMIKRPANMLDVHSSRKHIYLEGHFQCRTVSSLMTV